MSHHPNIELIEQVVDALGELTGQPEIVDEIAASDMALHHYLAEQMTGLLANENFHQALPRAWVRARPLGSCPLLHSVHVSWTIENNGREDAKP